MNTKNYFENEYTKMWIEDGVLYTTYSPNLSVTLDIAKQCIADRLKFTNGESYPMLCDIRNIKETDPHARSYMSKGDGIKDISAGAFIVKTQLEKFLFNTFFRLNKPPLPGRIFTDTKEALAWLKKHKHFQ